jgi:DNA excision repair protein ERCC-4
VPAARIVVDERERPSGIPDLLCKSAVIVDFAQLKVGDYIVSPDTAVERKTVNDLVHSIYDGRLYVQCADLVKHYLKPIVIVQGDLTRLLDIPADIEEEKKKKMAERLPLVLDALATVAIEFRIPVLHVPDAEHTALLLGVLAAKGLQAAEGGGVTSGPLLKKIRKENSVYLQQLSVLSSVPGVGDKLASRMLQKFKTPQRALTATAAELATIPGFGLARAQRMRKILDNSASSDSVVQRTLFES